MSIGNIGVSGFILIFIVALLLFGPDKVPEFGRALGKTMHELKKGLREFNIFDDNDKK